MNINNELLYSLLAEKHVTLTLPFTKEELEKACKNKSTELLTVIVGFLRSEELDDFSCLDQIVTLLNNNHIGTGLRHQF